MSFIGISSGNILSKMELKRSTKFDHTKKRLKYADENFQLHFSNDENFVSAEDIVVYFEGKILNVDIASIPRLYKKYKQHFVEKLIGEFVIILYDAAKKELLLFSDSRNTRKCYYYFKKDFFIFSSNIKNILRIIKDYSLDKHALIQYLFLGTTISPNTFFEGILQIASFEIIKIKLNQDYIEKNRYSQDLNFLKKNFDSNYLKTLFLKSVSERIRNEEKVGIWLSGGIDSSVLVYLASQCGKKINTYTVGYHNSKIDESKYADIVSEFFDTNQNTIFIDSSTIEISPLALWYYEFPNQNIMSLVIFPLAQASKREKTVLGGAGIEEIFMWGKDYKILNFANNIPPVNRIGVKKLPLMCFSFKRNSYQFYKYLDPSKIKNLIQYYSCGKTLIDRYNLLRFWVWDFEYVPLRQKFANSNILYPFFDERLIKYCRMLSTDKILFLKLFKDKIPPEISKRKRQGLAAPSKYWLDEQKDKIDFFVEKFVQRKIVGEREIRKYLGRPYSNHWNVWSIFSLEVFLEIFFDKKSLDKPVEKLSKLL